MLKVYHKCEGCGRFGSENEVIESWLMRHNEPYCSPRCVVGANTKYMTLLPNFLEQEAIKGLTVKEALLDVARDVQEEDLIFSVNQATQGLASLDISLVYDLLLRYRINPLWVLTLGENSKIPKRPSHPLLLPGHRPSKRYSVRKKDMSKNVRRAVERYTRINGKVDYNLKVHKAVERSDSSKIRVCDIVEWLTGKNIVDYPGRFSSVNILRVSTTLDINPLQLIGADDICGTVYDEHWNRYPSVILEACLGDCSWDCFKKTAIELIQG